MSVCRSCGNQIIWGETMDGKKIPMDFRAPVYGPDPKANGPRIVKLEQAWVSHFSVCPDASKWSGHKSGDPMPERHFSEPKEVS